MEEEVTLDRVLQCRAKCRDEIRWEISDKSDRVIDKDFLPFSLDFSCEPHLRNTGSESSKEFILREHSLPSERIKK